MTIPKRILLAEDDAAGVELTLSALAELGLVRDRDVVVVEDGEQALDYLYCRGPFQDRASGNPALILMDIKMPKLTGLDVLRQIRSDPKLRRLPVVALTFSREESDLAASYDLGVNAYVVKPVDYAEFVQTVKELGVFWILRNTSPLDPPLAQSQG